MIQPFKGPYYYDYDTVNNWDSSVIGVYYCGAKTLDGKLTIYYIGRGVGDDGIRGRLLQHLNETKWNDVTHSGYEVCDTEQVTINHETSEIEKHRPKYNKQGK